MNWLAKRRFNHVDAVGLVVASNLFVAGQWVAGILVTVVVSVLSVGVEMSAIGKEAGK